MDVQMEEQRIVPIEDNSNFQTTRKENGMQGIMKSHTYNFFS